MTQFRARLFDRCWEVLNWRRTGLLEGTAIDTLAASFGMDSDAEPSPVRQAEDLTVREALAFVVGSRSAIENDAVRLYGIDEIGKREANAYALGRSDALAALSQFAGEWTVVAEDNVTPNQWLDEPASARIPFKGEDSARARAEELNAALPADELSYTNYEARRSKTVNGWYIAKLVEGFIEDAIYNTPEAANNALNDNTIERQADKTWAVFAGGGFRKGGFLSHGDASVWLSANPVNYVEDAG